jgi:hypothetical protein
MSGRPPTGTRLVPLGVAVGLARPPASAHAVIFFLFFIFYLLLFNFRLVGLSNPFAFGSRA